MDKRKYEKYIMLFSTDWCSDRCTFVALVLVVRDRRIWRDVTGGSGSIDSSAGDRWNSSDGFLDTSDALSSWQTTERRLEILKDPHTGAFAIIACCSYFLAAFGIWTEAKSLDIGILGIGFILSRTLSGFGVCKFPCAKKSGLAATFAEAADRKRCTIVLIIEMILCMAAMIWLDPLRGAFACAAAVLVCLGCRHLSMQKFGGITGDTQGFFLQVCELVMAFVVILIP